MKNLRLLSILLIAALLLPACQPSATAAGKTVKVLAIETFLGDMARNVAGDLTTVDSLIPPGVDPHAFEPTPQDVARIANSSVLIVNGAGLESWLQPVLDNAGGQREVIVASSGLKGRTPKPGELEGSEPGGVDPHFWLSVPDAITYVENIRAGLSQVDPDHAGAYAQNAETYIGKLKDLDAWIKQQVASVPPEHRLLVTNHEEFGYFADQYGFKVVGTVIPSLTSNASPSAQELGQLSQTIRATGAPAIFLETGSNPQLAEQLASETGIKVVTGLYNHSTSGPDGPAPTYIDMMKYNTQKIVDALK